MSRGGDATLDPPVTCCGREFRLRRALAAHEQNHISCEKCAFAGCRAALKQHAWEVHGQGGPIAITSAQSASVAYGRGGGEFKVVDEIEEEAVPLEARFPGAEFIWDEGVDDSSSGGGDDCVRSSDISPLEWPAACRVILVLGSSGSGKSRLLRSLLPPGQSSSDVASHRWPDGVSILDGLGLDAFHWLAAVGLGSIPLWCQPHRALSTGEAFRANLARQLQAAAALHEPLVVDRFCDHLDPLSAACCAASLGRHLRQEGAHTRALLASCHARVAHWLRPDAVIVCRGGSRPVLVRIANADTPLPLRIAINGRPCDPESSPTEAEPPEAEVLPNGGELFQSALRRSGLPLLAERCCDDTLHTEAHRPSSLAPPHGGRVLVSRVERTEAIRTCETFFDLPHDGTCARRLPSFPTPSELLAPLGSRPASGAPTLGLICGPSGAAKSALLATHFGRPPPMHWPYGVALRTLFTTLVAARRWLCAVAAPLPEALAWNRAECSSGQQAMARLALALASATGSLATTTTTSAADAASLAPATASTATASLTTDGRRLVLFDEFGSAWDELTARDVSRALCAALRQMRTSSAGGQAREDRHGAEAEAHQERKAVAQEEGDEAHKDGDEAPQSDGEEASQSHNRRGVGLTVVLAGCHIAHVGVGALEPDWVFEAASATCFWFGRPLPEHAREHTVVRPPLHRALPDETLDPSTSAPPASSPAGPSVSSSALASLAAPASSSASIEGQPGGLPLPDAHDCSRAPVALRVVRETRGLADWHALTSASCTAPPAATSSTNSAASGASDGSVAEGKAESGVVRNGPVGGGVVEGGAASLAPPLLRLSLRRCDPAEWRRFHAYHYKSAELSTVATTFLLSAAIGAPRVMARQRAAAEDASSDETQEEGMVIVPAGFIATIPHSGKRSSAAIAPPQRAHRTVVLPEWQGFGVGSRLSDAAAAWHARCGSDYLGQTVHPRFGRYRDASPLWEPTEANHTTSLLRWLPRRLTGANHSTPLAVKRARPKMVYAHRYCGAADEVAQSHLDSRVNFADSP